MGNEIISSEADVFSLLSKLDAKEYFPVFEGWPVLEIRLEPGDGRTNPDITHAITAVQEAAYRLACLNKYDDPDLRRLTSQDRYRFRIPFDIESGSTNLFGDLSIFATEFCRDLLKKMPRNSAVVAVVACTMIHSSGSFMEQVVKSYAEIKKEEIRKEGKLELFDRVVAHSNPAALQLVQSAYKQDSLVRYAVDNSSDWLVPVLNTAPHSGSISVNGVEMETVVAKSVSHGVARHLKGPNLLFGSEATNSVWQTTVSQT